MADCMQYERIRLYMASSLASKRAKIGVFQRELESSPSPGVAEGPVLFRALLQSYAPCRLFASPTSSIIQLLALSVTISDKFSHLYLTMKSYILGVPDVSLNRMRTFGPAYLGIGRTRILNLR